jgi:hypothetical protein
MPIVRIFGLPTGDGYNSVFFAKLKMDIADAVANIKELNITNHQVSVFFPTDLAGSNGRGDICGFIDFFKDEKIRNLKVRRSMSTAIGELLKDKFRRVNLIEILPMAYDSEEGGYWSCKRDE